MIQRPLHEINERDLLLLIENKVPEKKTIEYKSKLPGPSDGEKKEFLYDVSSFANTSGGDLVFGIEEQGDVPVAIRGVLASDLGAEKRRLENLIRDGLDPRIRYDLAEVGCTNGAVVIFRIEQSWVRPHRVILGGSDKFYGRNSTGKYPLDVGELRAAFTASDTLTERVRAFRIDRTIAIANNDTAVPFVAGPKIVLHCVPLESFGGHKSVDFLEFYRNLPRWLPPNGASSRGINLDGALLFEEQGGSATYYQHIYRNGILEMVDGSTLTWFGGPKATIPNPSCEFFVLRELRDGLKKLQHLGVAAPVVVGLTLIGVKGFRMALPRSLPTLEKAGAIDRNTLSLLEAIVEDLSAPPEKILKPQFDMLWNACGFQGSLNYDADGNWSRGPY